MTTSDYTNKIYEDAINQYQNILIQKYNEGKNAASNEDYFSDHFIKTEIEPKTTEIVSLPLTIKFFNSYHEKSMLTRMTRFEIIIEHCKANNFELALVADAIARYDALILVWNYIAHQSDFSINTMEIYSLLFEKSGEEINLSPDTYKEIQHAIEKSLQQKGVESDLDWNEHKGGLYDYIFNRCPRYYKEAREGIIFAIPRYLVFHKKAGAIEPDMLSGMKDYYEKHIDELPKTYTVLSLDEDVCILEPGDSYYDFLFSVYLSIIDILQVEKFLLYHLTYSFYNNTKEYSDFLEAISIKHRKYLNSDLGSIINKFCSKIQTLETPKVESNLSDPTPPKEKEATLRKKVLAITYLLNELPIENDKTAIAEFIKLITGKELNEKTKDGNIYKMLKKPFPSGDKALASDLSYIRTYFEKLGLKEIVEKINKEILSNDKI